ncbi:MAG: bifunctional [glutamine synthetase] adenylyltransferase/[glutamine synthetase]-adenylyl-L-tyrosine phosphorylase, partial [Amphiplicatus sp.]
DGARRLAAFLGEKSAAAFEERLLAVLAATHRRFCELFEREERLSSGEGSLIFTGVENDRGTLETLEKLGFQRPVDLCERVRRWHMGAIRATRTARARELLTKLAPRLLEALSKASDPDAAFVAFDEFVSRLPAGVQVFALFANNPQIFDILIRLLTISPFLGRELARRGGLIEALLESHWPTPAPGEDLLPALSDRLARIERYEDKLNAVRRFAAEARFETAAQLVLGLIGAEEAALRFTATADAVLQALLPVAEAEIERRHGKIDGALAVIAMGRLGAGAMTSTSDLDLVFIYEAGDGAQSDGKKPLDAVTYYLRLVRRFLTALSASTEEGALYEVDMKLRPTGSKGPWAVSLDAFERYYEGDAWTWEEMALTKARVVAGDAGLAQKMRAAIDRVIVRERPPEKLAADVRDMRRRVAEAKPAGGPFDVKLAEGGLTDLEFTLAFLVLRHGAVYGASPPGARATLAFLREKGAMSREDAEGLLTALELFDAILQLSRAAVGGPFSPEKAGDALKARMAAAVFPGREAAGFDEAEEALLQRLADVKRIYDAAVKG